MGVSPDAWFGAIVTILLAIIAGVLKLIATTTRTETTLTAHVENTAIHQPTSQGP